MIAKCGRCSLIAAVTLKAGGSFSIAQPSTMSSRCPVVKERLQKKGNVAGEELTCENLERAASAVIEEWRSTWEKR